MSSMPNTVEAQGQLPDPNQLLTDLSGLDDQKKFKYLHNIFLAVEDVEEYGKFIDTHEDLTRRQLVTLKATLEGYKIELTDYNERTGKSIEKWDARFQANIDKLADRDLSPEVAQEVARTRVSFAKASEAVKAPRGAKGKSLKEVTASGMETKNELSPEQQAELLKTVKVRFEANMSRHQGIEWAKVEAKLEASPEKMWSLNEMERTGGEPDVVGFDKKTGEYIFNDCSAESPKGRRMICYDREGQELAEKSGYSPKGNAIDMAKAMGIKVLTESEYRELQKLGDFDRNTFTWLQTPVDIRKSGSALSGRRDNVVVGVNQRDARDHYDNRAFRGSLRV